MGLGSHVTRVEVQTRNGVAGLGLGGLLLDGDGPTLRIELHDAKTLRIVHVVAKHRGTTNAGVLHGSFEMAGKPVTVEDIVTEDEGARLAVDELLADGEGLDQAIRRGLLGVGEVHAVARTISEQTLEIGEVRRRGDNQDVPDARQHEGGQWVVDHRLVVHGQQLLRRDERERVKASAGPAGEDNAFHELVSFHMALVIVMTLELFDRQLLG